MSSAFISWRLYSCRRLACASNMDVGVHLNALLARTQAAARRCLFSCLIFAELLPEGRVVGKGLQLGSADPGPCASRRRWPRRSAAESPGLHCISQRRWVMPLVMAHELLRLEHVEVVEGLLASGCPYEAGRHAVDRMGVGHAEVGHVHLIVAENRHVADALPLAGDRTSTASRTGGGSSPAESCRCAAAVLGEQRSSGQRSSASCMHRVVGVGEGAAADVLRLVPAQIVLVHQHAHQLGDGHGRDGYR